MAIVLNQGQEQEQNQQQPLLGGVSTPNMGGGMVVPQQRPASSGQFTNVQRFIAANQGIGSNIANRISETTAKTLDPVNQGVNQLSELRQGVEQEQERVRSADEIAKTIRENVTSLTSGPQFDRARQLITGQTAADQQRAQFQNVSDQFNPALMRSQQQINQLRSEPGRFNLLRQVIGAPSYTTGQQRLDQLLTQTEGARTLGEQFQQQRGLLGQKQAIAQDLSNQIQAGIGDYTNQAAQASQMLTGLLGSEVDSVRTAAQQALQAENQRRLEDEQLLQRYFSGELKLNQNIPGGTGAQVKMQALSPEQQRVVELLTSFGLSPGQRSFGVLDNKPLSSILTNIGTRATNINQVMSDSDIARLNALERLRGNDAQIERQQLAQLGLNPDILGQIQERQRQFNDLLRSNIAGTYTWGAQPGSGVFDSLFGGGGISGGSISRNYNAADFYNAGPAGVDRLLESAFGNLGNIRTANREIHPLDSLRVGAANFADQLEKLGYFGNDVLAGSQKSRSDFLNNLLNQVYSRQRELAVENLKREQNKVNNRNPSRNR